jgi:uncharacterized repeat protein (TIGR03803 family)
MGGLSPHAALAQTFTTLYSFHGIPDGWAPVSKLVMDADGNLYGTTYNGGDSNACPFGCGTIFKVDPAGTESVLHSFNKDDGRDVDSDLIIDSSGNLYGVTSGGGIFDRGTVFKFDTNQSLSTLYTFNDQTSGGSDPRGGLLRDANGNLYGTTVSGHVPDCYDGTIFKLSPSGQISYLHCFSGPDGYAPFAKLARDVSGTYGTTAFGGAFNSGSVFTLNRDGSVTVLHSFSKGPDAQPLASLAVDAGANLYGTTEGSFTSLHCQDHGGCGTVFKLDPSGNETVLHLFTGGADGSVPQASVLLDKRGNLYGTTTQGGLYNRGTLFRISASGNLKVLHDFAGGADGSHPQGGLIRDSAGNLYGTTLAGGVADAGTVFKLSP